MQARVVNLLSARGFGFLRPMQDGDRRNLFFHAHDTIGFDELREGDFVTFQESESKGRPCAVRVEKLV